MIIIRNKHIPIAGFSAMNILGILFVRKDAKIDNETYRHEAIHTQQQYEIIGLSALVAIIFSTYFATLWYLALVIAMPIALYILAWFIEFLLPPYLSAYKDSPFEREAYENDDNPFYLVTRRPFAWVKYFMIRKRWN